MLSEYKHKQIYDYFCKKNNIKYFSILYLDLNAGAVANVARIRYCSAQEIRLLSYGWHFYGPTLPRKLNYKHRILCHPAAACARYYWRLQINK